MDLKRLSTQIDKEMSKLALSKDLVKQANMKAEKLVGLCNGVSQHYNRVDFSYSDNDNEIKKMISLIDSAIQALNRFNF